MRFDGLDQPVELDLDADGGGLAAGLEQAAEQAAHARAVALDDALEGDELADGWRSLSMASAS